MKLNFYQFSKDILKIKTLLINILLKKIDNTAIPIFIVGMPRSGTSLIDQYYLSI